VLQHVAVQQIRAHPDKYALNLAANVSRMLFAAPLGIGLSPPVMALYILCNVLLIGALIWAVVSFRRVRNWPAEAPAIALLALFGFAVHLPPSADPRMFMPLVPLLIWLVAQGWAVRGGSYPRHHVTAHPRGRRRSVRPADARAVAHGGGS
jgi:hypothetical protein